MTSLNSWMRNYAYDANLLSADSLYGIFVFDIMGNSLICLILALPLAKGVLMIRKKYRSEKS